MLYRHWSQFTTCYQYTGATGCRLAAYIHIRTYFFILIYYMMMMMIIVIVIAVILFFWFAHFRETVNIEERIL